MTRRRDPGPTHAEVAALRRDPDDAAVTAGLVRALGGASHVVVLAADIAGERGLDGTREALVAAWTRLYEQDDPNCVGKAACATALDRLDHPDRAPFRRGLAHVQMQAVYAHAREDVAGPLRARCALALARFGGPEALLDLAVALADPLATVRAAAAQGLTATGEPAAAALAMLKVRAGDADPGVVADALGALLALRLADGLAEAERLLDHAPDDLAELVLLALGQSRRAEVVPLLEAHLVTAFRAARRRAVFVALGLSRTDAARDLLLAQVRAASLADAAEAVRALGATSLSDATRAAAEAAAASRGLDAVIAEVFGG